MTSAGASASGAGVMVRVMESFTGPQGPLPAPLRVSTTDPLAMSLMPGVYIGSRTEVSLKLPSPAVCHKSAPVPEALGSVEDEAMSCTAPWQTSWSEPASTTGAGVTVTVMVAWSCRHPPDAGMVYVKA